MEKEPTKQLARKPDPVALSYYGDTFEYYMKLTEVKDLIPSFKEYYYDKKSKDINLSIATIVQGFNTDITFPLGRKFHPYPNNIVQWKKKWDADIIGKMTGQLVKFEEESKIRQLVKTRNEDNALVAPQDGDLESGMRTLGGELLNDAMKVLHDDQMNEEVYDEETIIKRRKYVVDVFAHVTKLVHGKAALMLKASEEKRNTAGFLMGLLSRAASGQMTDEEVELLKSSYPQQNVKRQE